MPCCTSSNLEARAWSSAWASFLAFSKDFSSFSESAWCCEAASPSPLRNSARNSAASARSSPAIEVLSLLELAAMAVLCAARSLVSASSCDFSLPREPVQSLMLCWRACSSCRMDSANASHRRSASSPCLWRSSRSSWSSCFRASTSSCNAVACLPASSSKRRSSPEIPEEKTACNSCLSRRTSLRISSARACASARREASPVSRAPCSRINCSPSFASWCLHSPTATDTSAICVRNPVMSWRTNTQRSALDSSCARSRSSSASSPAATVTCARLSPGAAG
mmetsp:Transcript_11325/g.31852  ORF Transcript_11325/g.31852 Transcript_11325/m.31852 type:complete len:281 (+) Transcript_11325:873-1715(+)